MQKKEELLLWQRIEAACRGHMDVLAPLRSRPRYAVQRPFSDAEISMIPHMYAAITALWREADGIPALHEIEKRIGKDLTINL